MTIRSEFEVRDLSVRCNLRRRPLFAYLSLGKCQLYECLEKQLVGMPVPLSRSGFSDAKELPDSMRCLLVSKQWNKLGALPLPPRSLQN